MKTRHSIILFALAVFSFASCKNESKDNEGKNDTAKAVSIKEEAVSYALDTVTFNSFVAYNENQEGTRPAVLVIPEWWGLNDYARGRAKQLAEMGYIAMAVDMYGGGKTAADPQQAQALATPFYMNPQLTKQRIDAAKAKLLSYAQADTSNVAAIGYCFGGYCVLNAAKLGADLKGVVSFHGNLSGAPATKESLKARILVCHGGDDKFVSEKEIADFKKNMDAVGANYKFIVYPGATHAFTNPAATEAGKKFNLPIAYNSAADSASWNDMKLFFGELFPKK